MKQITLFETEEKNLKSNKLVKKLPFKRVRDEYFDFKDTPASAGIYGIHPYPTMFHFLVVRGKIIKNFSNEGGNVLDPSMGSGVVAGECLINGKNFVGYDINPLAVLISKVRTTPIPFNSLLETLKCILQTFKEQKPTAVEFPNIHYWFDEDVIENLSKLRQVIFSTENNEIRDFSKVAFSETVRIVSKARYDEFKLVRKKDDNTLNVLKTFSEVSLKNIGLLIDFYNKSIPHKVSIKLEGRNIIDGIPLEDNSIDLVITSLPYGDSRTTVAYGQFSRLSLRWLWLEENVDRTSLGAKPKNINSGSPSDLLYKYIEKIANEDEKRAKEVFSFYVDLYTSIQIIAKKVKEKGFICFVVGTGE